MNDFEFHLDQFMLHCDAKNLSRKTLKSYEQTLRLFQFFLENECKVTEIKDVKSWHIKKYISHLRDRGKYTVTANENTKVYNHPDKRIDLGREISDTTIANYLRNIKVFFNYLFQSGDISENPVKGIPVIKPKRKQKELLDPMEIKRLLSAMDVTKFHEYRLWLGVRLILDTGCRVGELLELKPQDLDLKYNAMLVRNPKNNKQRYVYFSKRMSNDLKRWLKYRDRFSDSEYLFPTIRGTKQNVSNFEKTLKNIGDSVGISVTPHQLRNNFAKYYLLNGGDMASLSRILGHSSIDVTMKAYLDFTDDQIRQKYQRHSPLDNLKL
ncbi:tyrosine-type recombinase/integrase [Oceanobacillus caeni]|uniref:tyrosine-type recombinase/integrase n=1 Tax=Virgibacillus sp. SK37 TaxID=403957 RepID=UPI0011A580B0|nr:tyrosine-type recombinase/integrase [Virgibacillus sp. SK37]